MASRVGWRSSKTASLPPSNSGKGQKIFRCPTCWVAVWGNYAGAGARSSLRRLALLENWNAK